MENSSLESVFGRQKIEVTSVSASYHSYTEDYVFMTSWTFLKYISDNILNIFKNNYILLNSSVVVEITANHTAFNEKCINLFLGSVFYSSS